LKLIGTALAVSTVVFYMGVNFASVTSGQKQSDERNKEQFKQLEDRIQAQGKQFQDEIKALAESLKEVRGAALTADAMVQFCMRAQLVNRNWVCPLVEQPKAATVRVAPVKAVP
jgi:uncharacterized protein YlxW (UPF0749 family)